MKRHIFYVALGVATILSNQAFAKDIKLEKIIVKDEEEKSQGTLTVPSNALAEAAIKQTAGGVALVDVEDFADEYSMNLQDTLAYVPGVYAQKRFGEEVRISIRGSGLSRGFHMRGLQLLQDGIPFNLADGAADFQEADTLSFQRLEVYKGGNALQYGGTTLGGSVNMISKTGASDTGNQFRSEIGTNDTFRLNAKSGQVYDWGDSFINMTGTSAEGFREHSAQENLKLNSNLGIKLSDNAETRFYLSDNIIIQELPGSVSRFNALNNPKMADSSAISADQHRDIRSTRISNKTTVTLDNGDEMNVGAFLNAKNLFHPITPFVGIIDQQSYDYGLFAERSGSYDMGDNFNLYRTGITTQIGNTEALVFQNVGGSRGTKTADAEQTASNIVMYGENNFYITPEIALVAGAQLSLAQRDVEDNLTAAESDSKSYGSFNPKFGVLYEPTENLQYFANISKSYEAPTFSELTQSGNPAGFIDVKAQSAWTAEIGTRGESGKLAWDASIYRAWVNNELLQFTTGAGIPASTFNANNTIHQGLELGFDVALTKAITWKNAYTYSDFFFQNNSQFGNNTIAGQPPHFVQTELRYNDSDGWFIAPNIEWSSRADVDFSNELESPSFVLFGATAGVDITEEVSVYFDARNLLDKNYISTFSTITDKDLVSNNVFYAGDGRAVFAGLKVEF